MLLVRLPAQRLEQAGAAGYTVAPTTEDNEVLIVPSPDRDMVSHGEREREEPLES